MLIFAVAALFAVEGASGQHTLGVIGGTTAWAAAVSIRSRRRGRSGVFTAEVFTWRYYGKQRFVGGFGVDLEFQQQAFSFATNASQVDEKETANYLYYTRRINSMVLPVVWQPHFYLLKNHVRVYFEAAATFFYNFRRPGSRSISSMRRPSRKDTYGGTYHFKVPRDNRWGYGLAGGRRHFVPDPAFRVEFPGPLLFRLFDIVRNRNRYYDNSDDGPENPFYTTPMRSPLDNLMISVGVSYRFNKGGLRDVETTAETGEKPGRNSSSDSKKRALWKQRDNRKSPSRSRRTWRISSRRRARRWSGGLGDGNGSAGLAGLQLCEDLT